MGKELLGKRRDTVGKWAAAAATGPPAQLVAIYRRALRHDPTFSEAAGNLALLLGQAGRWEEAIRVASSVRGVARTRRQIERLIRTLRHQAAAAGAGTR